MSRKKLHIHSLPLIAFTVVATAVLVTSISTSWQASPVTAALLRPAVRLQATDHGYVKVVVNGQSVDERPGVVTEGIPNAANLDIERAARAAQSIGLQLSLENALQ
jgi:hypothetical protein